MGTPGLSPPRPRLHEAARILTERHDGQVPPSYEALLALPGIGRYTAAAVASFAFKQRTRSWTPTCAGYEPAGQRR